MKTFLHIHTSFSYDGEVPLEEIAEGARKHGAGIVFINDHLRGMAPAAYKDLIERARDLSDESMTIIPGLEVGIEEGGDLLALGVKELPASRGICALADEIHEQGGVVVLSHPDEARGISPLAIGKLDGIEVWNGLHDSKYFPNGLNLSFLRKARAHNPNIFGCCGLDLHAQDGWFPLYLWLDTPVSGTSFMALLSGAFAYGRKGLLFRASWEPSPGTCAAFTAMTFAYKACARLLKVTGSSVPPSLSRALRKWTGEQ